MKAVVSVLFGSGRLNDNMQTTSSRSYVATGFVIAKFFILFGLLLEMQMVRLRASTRRVLTPGALPVLKRLQFGAGPSHSHRSLGCWKLPANL